MVRYVQQRYTTDTSRVFVTGVSSGAMMTQVLLATYPDVFAAGSAFAGVPATCFATTLSPAGHRLAGALEQRLLRRSPGAHRAAVG